MEIQYQRNLKNSYMVIIEPERPLNPDGELAERMLQRQPLSGLLTWVSMEHRGDMTFWYQITGMQSLTDRLQQQFVDHILLQGILAVLLGLQEELPRYYLKPEHLLLRAEQIFIDTAGGRIRLCYEPMWSRDPRESLQELLEQLLPHIDHSDKAAVALAYGLYENCQQPNADVWRYVREQSQAFPPCGQQVMPTAEMPESGGEADASNTDVAEADDLSGRRGAALFSDDHNKNATHGTSFAQRIEPFIHPALHPILQQLPEKYKRFRKREKDRQPEPIYMFEPEEEAAVCENPTVYLGAGEHTQGRLNYVGSGVQPSFQVEGDAFLIGGKNGQADGQIDAPGVSRSHARITREEDAYYIEDLNSRNGTCLNGELLLYRQKRRLKSGDHLRFAQEEYIFY